MTSTMAQPHVRERQLASQPVEPAADPAAIKPLPVWFFGFEGVMGAAYDLCHVWADAWMVVVALAAVNLVVGLTVMRRRAKLVRAMLKNSRTRVIAIGLIALRFGAHLLLAAAGAAITSAAGHLAFAIGMAGATVTLLWLDQRIAFRALALR